MIPNENHTSTAIVLSSDESRILNALSKPDTKLEVILPAAATAEEMWQTLAICSKGVNYMASKICYLKPIIGQILVRFQNKPSLYKQLGYSTFKDFKFQGVGDKLGLGRNSIYEAMSVAERWPQVTGERYSKIGPKNINILNKFASGSDNNAEDLLKKAETMKVTELCEWAEDKGVVEPGETVPRTIEIHTTLATLRRWRDFCSDPNITAWVETGDHGLILEALMDECHNQWYIQGAGKIAQDKEKQQKEEKNDVVRNIDVQQSNSAEAGH